MASLWQGKLVHLENDINTSRWIHIHTLISTNQSATRGPSRVTDLEHNPLKTYKANVRIGADKIIPIPLPIGVQGGGLGRLWPQLKVSFTLAIGLSTLTPQTNSSNKIWMWILPHPTFEISGESIKTILHFLQLSLRSSKITKIIHKEKLCQLYACPTKNFINGKQILGEGLQSPNYFMEPVPLIPLGATTLSLRPTGSLPIQVKFSFGSLGMVGFCYIIHKLSTISCFDHGCLNTSVWSVSGSL